jgi:hypothetical protein
MLSGMEIALLQEDFVGLSYWDSEMIEDHLRLRLDFLTDLQAIKYFHSNCFIENFYTLWSQNRLPSSINPGKLVTLFFGSFVKFLGACEI